MLDWLRRDPHIDPAVEIAGRTVPVVIRRLERARRMTMRLAPDGSEVRISIPRWAHTAEAIAFAQSRRDWLAHQIEKLPIAAQPLPGTQLPFRGETLLLAHDPRAARRPVIADGTLTMGGAEASFVSRLARWLQTEARKVLACDLQHYCAKAGHTAPPLALSSARRRWGSCAPDGSIRINWRLIMAPDEVRRSVVAHEVAHLRHFDHSPAFHLHLRALFEGSVHEADRWLKSNGRTLYLPFG
jgi:Predicted metal-dependent hydrolase